MDALKEHAGSMADAVRQLDRASITGILCALLLATYVARTIQVWYRMSHIPGPFVAGFSRLWLVKQSLYRRQADALKEVNDKYGKALHHWLAGRATVSSVTAVIHCLVAHLLTLRSPCRTLGSHRPNRTGDERPRRLANDDGRPLGLHEGRL